MADYYIASCVFTSKFPALSLKIQEYVRARFGFEVVRCCVPKYKLAEFAEKMPEGMLRDSWCGLPDSGDFKAGDRVWSLCHNCNNIIDEVHEGVEARSLWELLDSDGSFVYPDLKGAKVYVQDCWRSRDRKGEQYAVRSILTRINAEILELPENREKADFCGASLYRPQPPRNPKLAPKHYVEGAAGKFVPHTPEEQERLMLEYCSRFGGEKVVCYCHYCLEGLLMGGADAVHLAELLFGR
jgi:hypothetical protein